MLFPSSIQRAEDFVGIATPTKYWSPFAALQPDAIETKRPADNKSAKNFFIIFLLSSFRVRFNLIIDKTAAVPWFYAWD